MIILAIDSGKVRTGVAVCDKSEILANPVKVITQRSQNLLATEIADIAAKAKAELVVIGLPRNMDGSEGANAKDARSLGQKIAKLCSVPIEFFDERVTTVAAHNYLSTANVSAGKRKAVVDSVAAVIILQDYLNLRKNKNA
ncbi:MAG: Holliday junction resolvase RuvX [Oscillospiraceae bacterium]|nr:Holliday junction resolvase RuvX [Oscillospiraceae bacterium]